MDERRRQRRQQRILEAGQSRLSKITGNEYLDKTPAAKPVRQQEPQEPSVFQRRNSTDDPSEELGAPEPINVLDHMLNESLLQQFSSSPFTNISNSNEQQQQTAVVADYSRYWNLLHLVLMTFLAVYAVYKERIVMGEELFSSLLSQEAHIYSSAYTPFFWYFALLELGLLSARFLLQKDQMTSNNSILATIASQLPHPYNQVINLFMRYRLIGTLFIQDIFILVFVTGLSIICMK